MHRGPGPGSPAALQAPSGPGDAAVPHRAPWPCRRNCRGNPNCLVGIGEHIWLGEVDESSFHHIDDPNFERRKKVTAPAGLVRLAQGLSPRLQPAS